MSFDFIWSLVMWHVLVKLAAPWSCSSIQPSVCFTPTLHKCHNHCIQQIWLHAIYSCFQKGKCYKTVIILRCWLDPNAVVQLNFFNKNNFMQCFKIYKNLLNKHIGTRRGQSWLYGEGKHSFIPASYEEILWLNLVCGRHIQYLCYSCVKTTWNAFFKHKMHKR